MQLDPNMLNQLLRMNDHQLSAFIGQIAREAGIDPAELGLNHQSMAGIRQALGSATAEDLQRLSAVYEEYTRKKDQK